MQKRITLRLADILKENDVTQKEIANKLQLSPSTVNDLCTKDIKRVNVDTLAKIAEIFEINDMNKLLTIKNLEQK